MCFAGLSSDRKQLEDVPTSEQVQGEMTNLPTSMGTVADSCPFRSILCSSSFSSLWASVLKYFLQTLN